jgi:hypothetical protein
LSVYNVERNILALYDPIKPGMDLNEDKKEFRERAQTFFANLQSHFGISPQRTPAWNDFFLIPRHPVAEDSGVVALVFARCILDQLSIYARLQFQAGQLQNYRKRIHDELGENKLYVVKMRVMFIATKK